MHEGGTGTGEASCESSASGRSGGAVGKGWSGGHSGIVTTGGCNNTILLTSAVADSRVAKPRRKRLQRASASAARVVQNVVSFLKRERAGGKQISLKRAQERAAAAFRLSSHIITKVHRCDDRTAWADPGKGKLIAGGHVFPALQKYARHHRMRAPYHQGHVPGKEKDVHNNKNPRIIASRSWSRNFHVRWPG